VYSLVHIYHGTLKVTNYSVTAGVSLTFCVYCTASCPSFRCDQNIITQFFMCESQNLHTAIQSQKSWFITLHTVWSKISDLSRSRLLHRHQDELGNPTRESASWTDDLQDLSPPQSSNNDDN